MRPYSVLLRTTSIVGFGIGCFLNSAQSWSFDTGSSPEDSYALLANLNSPNAPSGSWLRIHDLEHSNVWNDVGREIAPWPGATVKGTIASRRNALYLLRAKGYRLVAIIQWPASSWIFGTRTGQPLRRTPYNLQESFQRAEQLAATYGDLIDYWEIENEPDISFVEENPETFAAFFKSTALGVIAGRKLHLVGNKLNLADSHVLMAAMALPPGPYLESFLANGALLYSDAMNYHYYGYAEDFTGVNLQFNSALHEFLQRAPESSGSSVFSTQIYPSPSGFEFHSIVNFESMESNESHKFVEAMPRASEEPELSSNGNWLLSRGVTVNETSGCWIFNVSQWANKSLRPAVAILPIRSAPKLDANDFVSFDFRAFPETAIEDEIGTISNCANSSPSYNLGLLPSASTSSTKSNLPFFITEYGYGLLGRSDEATKEGRLRQSHWFQSTSMQAETLGIQSAMAFTLRPYLEANFNEFGLLMDSQVAEQKRKMWGRYESSPALDYLLKSRSHPVVPKNHVLLQAPRLSSIVIDFIAGTNLDPAKEYGGYILHAPFTSSNSSSGGILITYNLGTDTQTGSLELSGSWSFSDGARSKAITLLPGSKNEESITITSPPLLFAPTASNAVFKPLSSTANTNGGILNKSPVSGPLRKIASNAVPILSLSQSYSRFDCYIRTRNGNLYGVWPQLSATSEWERYLSRIGNFTMAFYGRANLPWKLLDNDPVALVFFFRPEHLPTRYEIRHAEVGHFIPSHD